MSSLPPDAFDDRDDDQDDDEQHDSDDSDADAEGEEPGTTEPPAPRGPFTRANPLTFIVPEPLLLRIERVDRPGAAPGEQPVAFTRAGPGEVLLAVNAYPT